jgi:hypothetical protein
MELCEISEGRRLPLVLLGNKADLPNLRTNRYENKN